MVAGNHQIRVAGRTNQNKPDERPLFDRKRRHELLSHGVQPAVSVDCLDHSHRDLANARGGDDNITVVLVRCE